MIAHVLNKKASVTAEISRRIAMPLSRHIYLLLTRKVEDGYGYAMLIYILGLECITCVTFCQV